MIALVINLRSRRDRWKKIREYFNDSITLKRLDAIRHPIPQYGLTLSFIKAIEYARDRGLPDILILEDDCHPVPDWENKWDIIKGWLHANPNKWDIYSGGSGDVKHPVRIGNKGDIIFYNPERSTASHWIYLEKRTYAKALKFLKENNLPEVGFNTQMNTLNTIISYPYIAYQESGYSNLKKETRELEGFFKKSEQSLRRRTRCRKD